MLYGPFIFLSKFRMKNILMEEQKKQEATFTGTIKE